ncbi:MAG: hypothetical protein EXS38_06425 [Opitutus sp.]|nr:hypothetical protein [Opitutus sp.]
MTKKKKKPTPRAALLGLSLDNDDGHKRITTGDQFAILGGSEETHGRMTETVVKTFEELRTRKKQLHQVEPDELAEILHKAAPR